MSSDMGLHLQSAHFCGQVFERWQQFCLESGKYGRDEAQFVACRRWAHGVNQACLDLCPSGKFFQARR